VVLPQDPRAQFLRLIHLLSPPPVVVASAQASRPYRPRRPVVEFPSNGAVFFSALASCQ
jgi:hypothetical protein